MSREDKYKNLDAYLIKLLKEKKDLTVSEAFYRVINKISGNISKNIIQARLAELAKNHTHVIRVIRKCMTYRYTEEVLKKNSRTVFCAMEGRLVRLDPNTPDILCKVLYEMKQRKHSVYWSEQGPVIAVEGSYKTLAAFLKPPLPGQVVRLLNGDPCDLRLVNIETVPVPGPEKSIVVRARRKA